MKQRKHLVFDVLFTATSLLLVMLYCAYSTDCNDYLTAKFVDDYLCETYPILNYNNPQHSFIGWTIYLLIASIIAFPLLHYVWMHRKRRYPRAIICTISLGIFFYLINRLGNTTWQFYPIAHSIKYIDLLGTSAIAFVIFGINARLRITPYKEKKSILDYILNTKALSIIKEICSDIAIVIYYLAYNSTIVQFENFLEYINEKLIKYSNKNKIDSLNGFSFDNPIDKSKNELSETLGRTKVAETIADKIRNTFDTQSAFAVGISGEWGSGKTSFLNLIKQELEKHSTEPRIIIQFSPWKNHSDTTIITDFFDTLGNELAKYDFQLQRQLQKYASVLVDADVDTLSKYAKHLKSFVAGTQSVADMYEDIDTRIRAIGYQIIIFIDDLDRLYKKEILETLKLIRNSAAFGNVVFVTAYHKKYVIKNIEQEIKECDNYLDKIFQVEFELPNYQDIELLNRFIDILNKNQIKKIDIEKIKKLNNCVIYQNEVLWWTYHGFHHELTKKYSFFTYENFLSLRDITRFANQFVISYHNIKFQYKIIDLLLLEYIRYKDINSYKQLYFQRNNIDFFNGNKRDILKSNNKSINIIVKSICSKDNYEDENSLFNYNSYPYYFLICQLNEIKIEDFNFAWISNSFSDFCIKSILKGYKKNIQEFILNKKGILDITSIEKIYKTEVLYYPETEKISIVKHIMDTNPKDQLIKYDLIIFDLLIYSNKVYCNQELIEIIKKQDKVIVYNFYIYYLFNSKFKSISYIKLQLELFDLYIAKQIHISINDMISTIEIFTQTCNLFEKEEYASEINEIRNKISNYIDYCINNNSTHIPEFHIYGLIYRNQYFFNPNYNCFNSYFKTKLLNNDIFSIINLFANIYKTDKSHKLLLNWEPLAIITQDIISQNQNYSKGEIYSNYQKIISLFSSNGNSDNLSSFVNHFYYMLYKNI